MEEKKFQLVQEFNFEDKNAIVRTMLDRDGEPWFVAEDVCAALDHTNSRMALKGLDDDEVAVSIAYTNAGNREVNIVNLAGLFTLLARSRKQFAAPFRRWVMHQVIPGIYRNGFYGMNVPTDIPENIEEANARWSYVQRQKQAMKNRAKMLNEAERICRAYMIANAKPYHVPINQQLSLIK